MTVTNCLNKVEVENQYLLDVGCTAPNLHTDSVVHLQKIIGYTTAKKGS